MSEVKMLNVDGEEVTIDDMRGKKGTLVIFSCNGCPWVKAWEKRIVALGNGADEHGIGVIVINSNDPKKSSADGYKEMKSRAKERGMEFPYVVDVTSDVARAYGATKTPEAFLFDAEGKLVYHGTIDNNAKKPDEVTETYLADAVVAVSAGEDVEVEETKALGCSIKFRASVAAEKSEKPSES
jgi:peroxiredoxin